MHRIHFFWLVVVFFLSPSVQGERDFLNLRASVLCDPGSCGTAEHASHTCFSDSSESESEALIPPPVFASHINIPVGNDRYSQDLAIRHPGLPHSIFHPPLAS
jgi:hypothetical protein